MLYSSSDAPKTSNPTNPTSTSINNNALFIHYAYFKLFIILISPYQLSNQIQPTIQKWILRHGYYQNLQLYLRALDFAHFLHNTHFF